MSNAISPPAYLEAIRSKAAERWNQLEADPELAGPWHTLFQQVQYPRHVLSELMQNADDAGATQVAVRIDNGVFTFEHNGADFQAEHFASLCRFAYSNKRNMHTIGFRGIGFKSTFSLGAEVRLYTPTLAVKFTEKRFTEPVWLEHAPDTQGQTRICVGIRDEYRQKELFNNLAIWSKSPLSLLFFNNLLSLHIADKTVSWVSLDAGPVPTSKWMTPSSAQEDHYLLIKSAAEAFPADAMWEIRQERNMKTEDEDFPPCQVDIVLGARGVLHVVLPTNVKTDLPFAINAPFIQDPGRLEIKDPSISPTNRWLLERVGRLAAETMLAWLGRDDLPLKERAQAYDLLPGINTDDDSLGSSCSNIIRQAFAEVVAGQSSLLTDDGKLVSAEQAVILSEDILDVWGERTPYMVDEFSRPALSRLVSSRNQRKLRDWKWIKSIGKVTVRQLLRTKLLPVPPSWRQLLMLWAYMAEDAIGTRATVNAESINFVPVKGSDVLHAARDVVYVDDRQKLQADEDWALLTAHLRVVNKDWLNYLEKLQDAYSRDELDGHEDAILVVDQLDEGTLRQLEDAVALLKTVNLARPNSMTDVIQQVATSLFAGHPCLEDCIRFTQIAAKLQIKIPENFYYFTRDSVLREVSESILWDEDGSIKALLPEQTPFLFLHPDYFHDFVSCSRQEWTTWVARGYANLKTWVPLVMTSQTYGSPWPVQKKLKERGYTDEFMPKSTNSRFVLEDWDFPEGCWQHWQILAEHTPNVWLEIFERITQVSESYWQGAHSAQLKEVGKRTNSVPRILIGNGLVPAWIMKLRHVPCMQDTYNQPRQPNELFRRTSATEPFFGIEPFVHSDVDIQENRTLLDILGVHSKPPSPERILSILRSFATQVDPKPQIVREVERWYDQLDDIIKSCSQEDRTLIRQAFHKEPLVLAQDGSWCSAGVVFLQNGDGIPGVSLVRETLKDLALWQQIGIAERPTVDLVIDWLQKLPAGKTLNSDDAKRVRSLLGRYPRDIWERCAHWLNLVDGWVSCDALTFSLTQEADVPWQHLFGSVKEKTADLRQLPSDIVGNVPFSRLPTLASQLSQHIDDSDSMSTSLHVDNKPWLETFSTYLARIIIADDEAETARIRELATRLAQTTWYNTNTLSVIPYLGNTPAGKPTAVDILWDETRLLVTHLPKAKLAQRLPKVLADAFNDRDIREALIYSFERSARDVHEYLEANFTLAAASSLPMTQTAHLIDAHPTDMRQSNTKTPLSENDSTDGDRSAVNRGSSATYDMDVLASLRARGTTSGHSGDTAAGAARSGASVGGSGSSGSSGGVSFRLPSSGQGSASDHALHSTAHGRSNATMLALRFALAQGYQPVGDDGKVFEREDGYSLAYNEDSELFPWELMNADGDVVCWYRPELQCLDDGSITVLAEVWTLLDTQPDRYALILRDAEEEPLGVSGGVLSEEVEVLPASYRLVYNS